MPAENPLVSVIIPTFQEEKYLTTALSTLIKSRPKVEIIVVDGGSSDKTVQIAKNYTKKVYQIGRRGIAKAKNHGAKQASGNILVFMDADVQPDLDFLEKLSGTFSDSRVIGATCNVMPQEARFTEFFFSSFYNFLIRVISRFRPHSQGKFFAVRREFFREVNGFEEDLPCLEDHDLAFRLSGLGKIVFINDLTVYEFPRRFRRLGLLRVVMIWFMDYVFFMLRGKPISRIWPATR